MKHLIAVYEVENDKTIEEMRLKFQEAKSVAMTPGAKIRHLATGETAFVPYARWFNEESSTSWNKPPFVEYNWLFLRQHQNWANDILMARGHVFLNDIHDVLGLSRTAMGQIVGWTYEEGARIDFGCWEQENTPLDPHADGAILLDFNVQGPILYALA